MAKWLQWLEQRVGGGPGGPKRVSAFRWLLLLGLLGVALMVLNSFLHVKTIEQPGGESGAAPPLAEQAFAGKDPNDKAGFGEYEHAYEAAIRDILQKVVAVGDVEVLVTIESTEETIVHSNAKDTQHITDEKDQNGSTRHITEISRSGEIVLYQASGGQTPIVLKKIKPRIRGVVVVAKGAENLTVKQMIAEAVSRGLDVPAHRISVLPRKQ
ncbi:stage III sporulation protein AG [Paenibacillus hodogayensis]|uniref:Stage III sporulation protein AG n=1 Tax=Paenibacillus hodogayensis TaxID=279208 RepID=A0ABV5W5L1_9BACL